MIRLRAGDVRRVVALGAHCDDIAIGAGGTLLDLCRRSTGVRVDALVLTGGGTCREVEEKAALGEFCPGAELSVTVLSLRDGRLPAHWDEAKDALHDLQARTEADLVLAPRVTDAHQDHRMLARLVPTVWRDALVLGYEIVKWDGDLTPAQAYVPLSAGTAREKARLLAEHYPSQRNRPWYDDEAFLGLARIRGIESRSPYAEAFELAKAALTLGEEGERRTCACY